MGYPWNWLGEWVQIWIGCGNFTIYMDGRGTGRYYVALL